MDGDAQNVHGFPGRALGKRPPTPERARVAFGDFVVKIPDHPISSPAPALYYPMDGNDAVGDCVVAGWDHARQAITALLTGAGKNFTQDEIWAFYKTQNPDFDPNGTASTNGPGSPVDRGMYIQQFLEYLVAHKYILAFAAVNYRNLEELKAATYLGLGLVTGVVLQQAQMGQQFWDGKWDYATGSAGAGGHCVPLVGYRNPPDSVTCVTWAKLVDCTPAFISNLMDEAWFILLQEHVDHPDFRNAFDLKGFAAAVSAITGGKVVVPVPPLPPAPPTPPSQYKFTRVLKFGSKGPDVEQLQRRLATEKAADGLMCYRYTENGALYFSQNFLKNTELALQRYQAVKGIVSSGTPQTTGYGQLGPVTMARLNGAAGMRTLVDAMIQVESGGDDWAEGDKTLKDHAYGCLQIRQGVVDQVNAYLKTSHKSQECLGNRALSLSIFNTYWKIFTGLVTDEDRAKAWNGGPGWKTIYGKPGYDKYTKALDAYWSKVQKAMQGLPVGASMSQLPPEEKAGIYQV